MKRRPPMTSPSHRPSRTERGDHAVGHLECCKHVELSIKSSSFISLVYPRFSDVCDTDCSLSARSGSLI